MSTNSGLLQKISFDAEDFAPPSFFEESAREKASLQKIDPRNVPDDSFFNKLDLDEIQPFYPKITGQSFPPDAFHGPPPVHLQRFGFPPIQNLPGGLAQVHGRLQPMAIRPVRPMPLRPFLPFPGGIPPQRLPERPHTGIGPPVPAIVIKKKRKKKNKKPKMTLCEGGSETTSKQASVEDQSRDGSDSPRRSEPDLTKIQEAKGNCTTDLDLLQCTANLIPTVSCPDLSDAQREDLAKLWEETTAGDGEGYESEVDNPVLYDVMKKHVTDGDITSAAVRELDQQVVKELELEEKLGPQEDLPEDEDDLFNRLLRDCVTSNQDTPGRAPTSLQDELNDRALFCKPSGFKIDQSALQGKGSAVVCDGSGQTTTQLLQQEATNQREYLSPSQNGINIESPVYDQVVDSDTDSHDVKLRDTIARNIQDKVKRLSGTVSDFRGLNSADQLPLGPQSKTCCSVM